MSSVYYIFQLKLYMKRKTTRIWQRVKQDNTVQVDLIFFLKN